MAPPEAGGINPNVWQGEEQAALKHDLKTGSLHVL